MDSLVIISIIIVVVVVFFIFRELMCWYWKINEKLEVQIKILQELKKLNQTKEEIHVTKTKVNNEED